MFKALPLTILILSLGLHSICQAAEALPSVNRLPGGAAALQGKPGSEHEHTAQQAHSDEKEHDEHEDHHEDVEAIIVQATRSGRIADEQPIRVELINREEIEEKAAMRPGNISMLLAETGGVRVQTTSPALGSANIRLQGLYGRYTQLLADGLPLYGNQAASIGLLQIPPTDLGRVEIIKGSASSLYGGSALGGVINLVSRRPGNAFKGETLLNITTKDGQDLTTYIEAPLSPSFQASITAGAHHQAISDVDNDGWIDLPGYERYTARPRLFWQGDAGQTLYTTMGLMSERREGGTLPRSIVSDGNPFVQTQHSNRFDTGLVFNMPIFNELTLNTRASAMRQEHEHGFGLVLEDDQHESYLLESSLAGYSENTDWVVGLAYQLDKYESQTFPQFDYTYKVPGVFSQLDYVLNQSITASMSARLDKHNEFGTQFSPRVSFLFQPGELSVRASFGRGYFAPTPFVEDVDAAGLSRLEAISNLDEESAQTASLDFTYTYENIESSVTFFGSNIDNVTGLEAFAFDGVGAPDRVRLFNAEGTSKIRGSELMLRYYWQDIKLTASYLYLDATELIQGASQRREIALTPKHSAGFVAMWEQHGNFRAGFEAYYTGVQRLNDNPFTDYSNSYWHLGLMGEIALGHVSYFINLENLLDVKQSDEHPIILPNRAPSGRWTTDIWSRNDGFIINAGVRVRFGA